MRTRSIMATGLAVAGTGAMVLSALTPEVSSPAVAAQQHEIMLVAESDFDLRENLGILWNGAQQAHGAAEDGFDLLVTGSNTDGTTAVETTWNAIRENPALLLFLPPALSATSQWLITDPAADHLNAAAGEVAQNLGEAGAPVTAAAIDGYLTTSKTLRKAEGDRKWAALHDMGAAATTIAGDPSLESLGETVTAEAGKLLGQAKTNRLALRSTLVGNDPDGQLQGALGAVRDAADSQQTTVRKSIDKLTGSTFRDNVSEPVRERLDKVRDNIRAEADKVRAKFNGKADKGDE